MTNQTEDERKYEIPGGSSVGGFCRGCNSRQTSMIGGYCGDCRNLREAMPQLVVGHASSTTSPSIPSHAEFSGLGFGHVFLDGVVYDLVERKEKCDHEAQKTYDALTKQKSNFCKDCGAKMFRRAKREQTH